MRKDPKNLKLESITDVLFVADPGATSENSACVGSVSEFEQDLVNYQASQNLVGDQ